MGSCSTCAVYVTRFPYCGAVESQAQLLRDTLSLFAICPSLCTDLASSLSCYLVRWAFLLSFFFLALTLLYVCMPACLSVCLSVCVSLCLRSLCLSVSLCHWLILSPLLPISPPVSLSRFLSFHFASCRVWSFLGLSSLSGFISVVCIVQVFSFPALIIIMRDLIQTMPYRRRPRASAAAPAANGSEPAAAPAINVSEAGAAFSHRASTPASSPALGRIRDALGEGTPTNSR